MTDRDQAMAVEVRAPRGARLLEILFEDGHLGRYPHELLRGFCPCASCQGHQGPVRFVREARGDGPDLELTDISEIGNYALRLAWADGHGTGIYSFNFLRDLCFCDECTGGEPREQVFSR